MENLKPAETFQISFFDDDGKEIKTKFQVKFKKLEITPSSGIKRKKYGNQKVNIIYAKEIDRTTGKRPLIFWKLITDLPINNLEEAIEKLKWNSLRWQTETFFKILKTVKRAEDSKLKEIDRLSKNIALQRIMSWRLFWLTILNRSGDKLIPKLFITAQEIKILDKLIPDKEIEKKKPKFISDFILKITKLGGYLNRKNDLPPSFLVIFRGLKKLIEIQNFHFHPEGMEGDIESCILATL